MVYVYESCVGVATFSTKPTQIIQTQKLWFTNAQNVFFKDEKNICWKYLGEYDDNYIAPPQVFTLTYEGNFFTKNIDIPFLVFPDCNSCLSNEIVSNTKVFYSAIRCNNQEGVEISTNVFEFVTNNIPINPITGKTYTVYNEIGDDFSVVLTNEISASNTNYKIDSPSWSGFNCGNTPLYKIYLADTYDGSLTGITIYDMASNETLSSGTSVNLTTDTNCYKIISYLETKSIFNFDSTILPKINKVFDSTNSCIKELYKNV